MAEAESKRQRRTPQERANELDEKIDKVHVEIDHLMATWEEYSEHLE